ncbi:hypothetical protein BD779DRAFT_3443 [Infundibulicybe gibba]|nr:hypothetical protein BD779DRAFT_3443 [Infundibulicybe gibba]
MATTQHYLWASGHFLLLISALRYIFLWITFKPASVFWYKASYTGALVSYAIVCQKSLGTPQPNLAFFRRAMLDENIQYFLLALFWFTSKPIPVTLLPFAIFSLFHALTFTRTTLMPQFLPPGPPNAAGQPQPHSVAKKLQAWVKANYDSAMRVVALTELLILGRVFIGAIAGLPILSLVLGYFITANSLLAPIVFAHFLRQRYYQSAFTREAVGLVTKRVDGYVRQPGSPPAAAQVWDKVQMLTSRWAGSTLAPNAGEAAGAAGAAPRR